MSEREKLPEYLHLLSEDFFIQDSLVVAPDLVGCIIETNKNGIITSGRIVETEAYPSYDAASHAYSGRHTTRTEIQYAKGGRLYVYQIMGLHLMTSVVVGEEGSADVVFIRSLEPTRGIEEMRKRRGYSGEDRRRVASGPGMLSVALGITKTDNGVIVYNEDSEVKIYKDDSYVGELGTGMRINLGVHGKDENKAKEAVERQWRFFDKKANF